jgi:hypothetical protein
VNERWHSSVPELATYHVTHAQHNCQSVVRERVPKQLSRGDEGTMPRHAEEAACLCHQAATHTARGGYLADILIARQDACCMLLSPAPPTNQGAWHTKTVRG